MDPVDREQVLSLYEKGISPLTLTLFLFLPLSLFSRELKEIKKEKQRKWGNSLHERKRITHHKERAVGPR